MSDPSTFMLNSITDMRLTADGQYLLIQCLQTRFRICCRRWATQRARQVGRTRALVTSRFNSAPRTRRCSS